MAASHHELTQSIADAFNALADEAQGLNDRRVVLEHKLRFAHEQFQYLADKYAPAAPEITETLAKLQLPPQGPADQTSSVPLPRRSSPRSQHEIALVIRDGRRMASQLTSLGGASKTTDSTRDSFSRTSPAQTSMSTALEQDFTVEGRKGNLQCPFSKPIAGLDAQEYEGQEQSPPRIDLVVDNTPHHSSDPICAAMAEELNSGPGAANSDAVPKCPIRYMDQHSPEEITEFFKAHKHSLPRSHEICLRRYQHNEEQIRKIDSKYGNMVSMIEGLSQLHQPMLPEDASGEEERPRRQSEVDRVSSEKVQKWAKAIDVTTETESEQDTAEAPGDRQSHFDRPLKEVRVGESPSRPWGISVPILEPVGAEDGQQPMSPPPAPVRIPEQLHPPPETPVKKSGNCPFDHAKLASMGQGMPTFPATAPEIKTPITPEASKETSFSPKKQESVSQQGRPPAQPAFINADAVKSQAGGMPQMVFNGPVFIGYPMDQALQFMNQYHRNSNA